MFFMLRKYKKSFFHLVIFFAYAISYAHATETDDIPHEAPLLPCLSASGISTLNKSLNTYTHTLKKARKKIPDHIKGSIHTLMSIKNFKSILRKEIDPINFQDDIHTLKAQIKDMRVSVPYPRNYNNHIKIIEIIEYFVRIELERQETLATFYNLRNNIRKYRNKIESDDENQQELLQQISNSNEAIHATQRLYDDIITESRSEKYMDDFLTLVWEYYTTIVDIEIEDYTDESKKLTVVYWPFVNQIDEIINCIDYEENYKKTSPSKLHGPVRKLTKRQRQSTYEPHQPKQWGKGNLSKLKIFSNTTLQHFEKLNLEDTIKALTSIDDIVKEMEDNGCFFPFTYKHFSKNLDGIRAILQVDNKESKNLLKFAQQFPTNAKIVDEVLPQKLQLLKNGLVYYELKNAEANVFRSLNNLYQPADTNH